MAKTFLIAGATGLLGPYLLERASKFGRAIGLSRTGGDIRCDMTDKNATHLAVQSASPDYVIYAAGMTDVDACEKHPEAAYEANVETTRNILAAITPTTKVVFFSSIAVYPDEHGPHSEGTEGPVNVYGQTKLEAEKLVAQHANHLILRASMFGPSKRKGRKSLSDFITSKLKASEELTLFDDELFSPLHIDTLSALTIELALSGLKGVYNAASRDGTSKSEFGFAVAKHLKLPTDTVKVAPSRNHPGRSKRALDMRLNPSRLEAALGRQMPTLQEEVEKL